MSTNRDTDTSADLEEVGDNAIEAKETEGQSQGKIVFRKFLRHKGAMGGLIVLVGIAVFAFSSLGIFGLPGWWIHNHTASGQIVNPGGGPTWSLSNPFNLGEHPFGQDEIGRDNFARVMKGTQISIMVMAIIGGVALVIGTIVGALAGYYRGWVDAILMRVTDGFIILPTIVVGAILGRLVSGTNGAVLGLVLGAILWTGLARLVRGDFLSLREREFVDSARVAGAGDIRIMFKHMLPNAMGVIIVNTTLLMSQAIVLEAALSFLGFGIQPPDVSLGQLISEYQSSFATRPWLFWWPGLFIVAIALSINFIGDGLRDAFDPRMKTIPSWRKMKKAERMTKKGAK
ncbi:ABC transporter permease [Brevibacterium marinum]|uniref:Peptide/nickel transport system permease protein n=1 Tax=Brevibacterium marinum TaxID=418643 RepID=A0A846S458_9MICO|nr:ABC transporter permease [Brevibacterium marinum]NJC57793.1 peptide/nickel transport system permease protein [Brevibacterium marinum]